MQHDMLLFSLISLVAALPPLGEVMSGAWGPAPVDRDLYSVPQFMPPVILAKRRSAQDRPGISFDSDQACHGAIGASFLQYKIGKTRVESYNVQIVDRHWAWLDCRDTLKPSEFKKLSGQDRDLGSWLMHCDDSEIEHYDAVSVLTGEKYLKAMCIPVNGKDDVKASYKPRSLTRKSGIWFRSEAPEKMSVGGTIELPPVLAVQSWLCTDSQSN